MNKWLLYIACFYFVLVIGGCVEETVSPDDRNVNVNLFDFQSLYLFDNDFYFSIGEFPIARPDYAGNVKLKTNKFPYDLRLYVGSPVSNYSDYFYYEGINEKSLSICFNNSLGIDINNEIILGIQVPKITVDHQRGYAIFISNENCINSFSGIMDSTGNIFINLPYNKHSISGKIIYFVFTYDDSKAYCIIQSIWRKKCYSG